MVCLNILAPASDPAQNPYWKRDVRRAYPKLSVVTQSELSTLLLDHAKAQQMYVLPPITRFWSSHPNADPLQYRGS